VFKEIPGFEPIPFAEIGLKLDEYRKSLPPRAPRIVPDGGAFAEPMTIVIEAGTAGVEVHYTLDGSVPTGRSPLYRDPLVIAKTALLRAVSLPVGDPGARPSPVAEAAFSHVEFGKGKGVYLSDLPATSSFAHGGLIKDRNYRRNDFVTFAGAVHQKSIMICPEARKKEGDFVSHATYELTPPLDKATHFRAVAGIDDGADSRGSVVFRVEIMRGGEWQQVYESPMLYGGAKAEHRPVDVDIRGATALRLSTDGGESGNADHAAWGSARLE
jgi:hypothetical protein